MTNTPLRPHPTVRPAASHTDGATPPHAQALVLTRRGRRQTVWTERPATIDSPE